MEKSKKTKKQKKLKSFQIDPLSYTELRNPCSNTADFYEAIPKYFWGKQQGQSVEQLEILERKFTYQKVKYSVCIHPAVIQTKEGTSKKCFPGEREELVEYALKKMISEEQSTFLDDNTSILFTLCQLEYVLKNMGHYYNKSEIEEAIMICAKTHIEVQTDDGNSSLMMCLFGMVMLKTQEDWKTSRELTRCSLKFNILMAKSLKSKTFKLVDYGKPMMYQRILARWLYKRLFYYYKQNIETHLYTTTLSRIINDSYINQHKEIRNNLYDLKASLEEMKTKEVLAEYKVEEIVEERKLADAKITLTPHGSFIQEMKYFNHHYNQIRSQEMRKEALKVIQKYLNRRFVPSKKDASK